MCVWMHNIYIYIPLCKHYMCTFLCVRFYVILFDNILSEDFLKCLKPQPYQLAQNALKPADRQQSDGKSCRMTPVHKNRRTHCSRFFSESFWLPIENIAEDFQRPFFRMWPGIVWPLKKIFCIEPWSLHFLDPKVCVWKIWTYPLMYAHPQSASKQLQIKPKMPVIKSPSPLPKKSPVDVIVL